ncbi:MAG: hypothetical protein R3B70_28795 [Polyangiaceae bacterium]
MAHIIAIIDGGQAAFVKVAPDILATLNVCILSEISAGRLEARGNRPRMRR